MAGMTLLEVMIAMVIVSVGVLTVLQSQAASHRLLSRTQARERLAVFAEGIMEKVIAGKEIPATGKITGSFPAPNADVSWSAAVKRHSDKAGDTSALVRIDLMVKTHDGDLTLSTDRFWP